MHCTKHQPVVRLLAAAFGGLIYASASNAATLSEMGVGGVGDFSNARLGPTDFVLDYTASNNGSFGFNILTGQFGRNTAGVVDLDYIHLSVPQGFALSQILVGNQTTVGGNTAFIGLAAGATMPVLANASSAAGLLGWDHFGIEDRGSDILDDMAVPNAGSSGFSRPIPAGDYTVWLQELAGGGPYPYRLNFVVSPVPLPGASWLLGSGMLGLIWARRGMPLT